MAASGVGTTIIAASCSKADVQNAINACPEGGTVIIPAGTATWTGTGITVSKGITIQGAGAGGLLGHSDTALTLGTGLKTFALTPSSLTFDVGQTVRALYVADGQVYMEGTVVSSSPTSLTLNVTSEGKSTSSSGFAGPFSAWTFSTPAATTIINSTSGGESAYAFDLQENSTASIQLSGIHFVAGTGQIGKHVIINYGGADAKPALIYDDWFTLGTGMVGIRVETNRGIIYNCSFDSGFNSSAAFNTDEALQFKDSNDPWNTNSMMGAKDTTGLNNFYIEDNYFANTGEAADYDDGSRTVTRYNIFDNATLGTHGADTSYTGARYFEIYDNRFIFNDMGADTYNLQRIFWVRGGTGVFFDNVVPDIKSQMWGDKGNIELIVMNLQRDAGPYPLWTTYPAPHEVGQGYENGANITDPFYIWGNTGSAVANTVTLGDYVSSGLHPDTADFLIEGRDYIVGTAKPGYSESQYPNPLRGTVGPVGVIDVDGGAGTIVNDNSGSASLAIAATDASKAEGNTGSTPFTFTVTRSGNTTGLSSATYTVAGSGANPANNATDFSGGALPTGTVSFAAGETSKLITINVAGDTTPEANEGFTVTLSAPSAGTTIATAAATGTIVNDNSADNGSYSTSFPASENPISEGGAWINGGTTGLGWGNVATISGLAYGTSLKTQYADPTAVLTGTWASDQEAQGTVEINGSVGGGSHEVELRLRTTITAHSITGYEINANTNSSNPYITIVRWDGPLNSWTQLNSVTGITVKNGDVLKATAVGSAVTVYLNGTQVLQATDSTYSTGSPGIGFYDDGDTNRTNFGFSNFSASNVGSGGSASLAIAATDASKAEGNTGSTPFTFTVTRSGNTTGLSSATYTVAGSGANPANNATDFSGGALPTGTVSFAAGETSKLITINVAGDTTPEANEGFTVTLSAPSAGTTIATAAATGTIVNDDSGSASLAIAATDASKAEGNTGSTPFTFTVTRSGNTTGLSSATYTVAGSGANPANNATDFSGGALPTGTVSFAAGETSKLITINVAGDTTPEANEGFTVTLSAPSAGTTIATAAATGTIVNDDSADNGSYSTSFPASENPISEGGAWINGGTTGLDWGNVATISGLAYGTSLKTKYADPTAVLTGTWASDQEAQGTVEINGSVGGGSHEVELRLRTTITAHSITGYEINANTNSSNPYITIVRWDGPLNSWTQLNSVTGITVKNGDVLKATAVGSAVTVYLNGTQVLQATDSTYSTGSPGIGFYDDGDTNWTNFGFSNFSASNVGSGGNTPRPIDQDNAAEVPSLTITSNALNVAAGGSIALGINAAPVDSDDRAVTDLTLKSNYTGTSHPINVLTVTATNSTAGETATLAPKTITVTDPPAAATLTSANAPLEASFGSNRAVWLSELKPYDLPSAIAQDWAGELRASTIGGLDLSDIDFGGRMTLGDATNGNSTGGGLTESDSSMLAGKIALLSQCMAADFAKPMDGFDGTLIHDTASVTRTPMLALPEHG